MPATTRGPAERDQAIDKIAANILVALKGLHFIFCHFGPTWMAQMMRKFGGSEDGATAPIFAIMMVPLFAMVAAAMTFNDVVWRKTSLSTALDTAVLAGTILPDGTADDDRIRVSELTYRANLKQSVAQSSKSSEIDFIVEEGEASAPVFQVSGTSVRGSATMLASPGFVRLLGTDSVTVRADAKAVKIASEPVCILALDETQSETIDLNGKASISAEKCAAMANSSDHAGLRQIGGSHMKASQIGVAAAGYQGSNFEPKVETGVGRINDPYADLAFPPSGPCIQVDQRLQQSVLTLDPGNYCGGLYIKADSHVTLNPGIYIFSDGPLRIDSGATVFGREVLIAFTGRGATLQLYSGARADLTSPISGTYTGLQFYGARETHRTDLWATAIGDSALKVDGAMYFPTQHIWFAGGSVISVSSPTYAIVTKKLWVQDNSILSVKREDKRELRMTEADRFEFGARLVK